MKALFPQLEDCPLKLIDVQQGSEILGVPKSWFYGRIHAGNLPFPYLKIGHYLRFRPEDIEKYIEAELKTPGGKLFPSDPDNGR